MITRQRIVPPAVGRRIQLALFLLTTVIVSATSQYIGTAPINTSVDVFPLKSGLRFSFNFYSYSSDGDGMITTAGSDSGRVSYIILDSSLVNDTTVGEISEIRDFTRKIKHYSPVGGYDSTVILNDTVQYLLTEYLSGKHEVYCSATVWNFPLGHIRSEVQESVFRMHDSIGYTMAFRWSNKYAPGGAHGSGNDTVVLSSTYGLYRRNFSENWASGYLYGSTIASVEATSIPTDVNTHEALQPLNTTLLQNYPNPFNSSTAFVFFLQNNEDATLEIFTMLGKEVTTILQGDLSKGLNTVHWSPRNVSSGIYFYRLRTKNYIATKKLLYLK